MLLQTLLPAALLFSTSVAGLAIPESSSGNSTLHERDLEARASDGVITTCTKPKTFAMTFDDGPVSLPATPKRSPKPTVRLGSTVPVRLYHRQLLHKAQRQDELLRQREQLWL